MSDGRAAYARLVGNIKQSDFSRFIGHESSFIREAQPLPAKDTKLLVSKVQVWLSRIRKAPTPYQVPQAERSSFD
ncbi:hypothetical protein GCM10023155_32430 [Bremerella cremea]